MRRLRQSCDRCAALEAENAALRTELDATRAEALACVQALARELDAGRARLKRGERAAVGLAYLFGQQLEARVRADRKLSRRQPEDHAEWAEIEALKDSGLTDEEIEERLGLSIGTLAKRRWRRKHGRR